MLFPIRNLLDIITTLIFYYFFEFYQNYNTFNIDVGRSFYAYMAENNTEIFTTFQKFTDPNRKCAHSQGYNKSIYFMVLNTRHITSLDFSKALEKQDSPIFDVPWSPSMKYDKSQYTTV